MHCHLLGNNNFLFRRNLYDSINRHFNNLFDMHRYLLSHDPVSRNLDDLVHLVRHNPINWHSHLLKHNFFSPHFDNLFNLLCHNPVHGHSHLLEDHSFGDPTTQHVDNPLAHLRHNLVDVCSRHMNLHFPNPHISGGQRRRECTAGLHVIFSNHSFRLHRWVQRHELTVSFAGRHPDLLWQINFNESNTVNHFQWNRVVGGHCPLCTAAPGYQMLHAGLLTVDAPR
mmetsp:Transcript_26222/g.42096  ORF Transcript_26222/g.42096 Transcript_26222/m.42096 type:complete len:226 (-) Transcript_26222:32-709(-)